MNLTVLALTLAIAAPQAVGTPAPQAGAAEPLALLKARTAEVKALMGQPPDDARKAALRKLVGGIVDYHALAQSSLKKHWGERTPEERIEFESLLRQLIEKSYLEQIERQPDFQVKWEGSKLIKNTLLVFHLSLMTRLSLVQGFLEYIHALSCVSGSFRFPRKGPLMHNASIMQLL